MKKLQKLLISKHTWWGITAVSLLVVLAAVGLFWRMQEHVEPSVYDTATLAGARESGQHLAAQGQYDEAVRTLVQYIDQAENPDEQYQATVTLAQTYEKAKSYELALQTYQEAEQLQGLKMALVALGMAQVHEQLQNTAAAKTYYQKFLDALPNDPTLGDKEAYRQYAEAQIKRLEQQPETPTRQ